MQRVFIHTLILIMSRGYFYITLPSNASLDIFPNNKTTGYRVKLPEKINLDEDWEVGLYSILYPHMWYTIPGAISFPQIYYNTGLGYFLGAIID